MTLAFIAPEPSSPPRFWAVIPCAGVGARAMAAGALEPSLPKQYQPLLGQPLVLHTLAAFAAVPQLAGTLVAVASGDDFLAAYPSSRYFTVPCGGPSRAQTVLGALRALLQRGAQADDWVLVHDAARCLVTSLQIETLIAECQHDSVGALLAHSGNTGDPLQAVSRIAVQLLLPFALGHLLRPWTGKLLQKAGQKIRIIDQGSILLVVYAAFSSAVVGGLWQQMPLAAMATLLGVCAVLLAISMAWCLWISRRLGFNQADEATILFCGAQKSLVSGIPMANVLFSAAVVGPMILPVMLFHPMQIMVSGILAGRYGRQQAQALADKQPGVHPST